MISERDTLNGSLSVLKLMPGTYFNQTGNPLKPNTHTKSMSKTIEHKTISISFGGKKRHITPNSILHKHKVQYEDSCKALLSEPTLWTELNHFSLQSCTENQEKLNNINSSLNTNKTVTKIPNNVRKKKTYISRRRFMQIPKHICVYSI